jgi:hypothetical protein
VRNTCLYKLAGPKTFRRSSTGLLEKKFILDGKIVEKAWGTNLQNLEKSIRGIYYPDGFSEALTEKCLYWLKTGETDIFTPSELECLRVFLQADQSGAEALVVAYECWAGDYRKLFENNVKPHVYVAMKLFKDIWTRKMKEKGGLIEDFDIESISSTSIPQLKLNPFWKDLDLLIKSSDNWPLSERYYYFAKQTCHSANYDIQTNTFQLNVLEKSGGKVNIPHKEAERFLITYRSLFPEIPERNQAIERQVREHRMLFNLFGHPYIITDWHLEDRNMKEYYAWSAQSTVGEITRTAYCNLYEYIRDSHLYWDILADTHDSYLSQCPLVDIEICAKKMQEFLGQEFSSPVDGARFKMKSEVNIGFNWGPKKDTNPLGLQELEWMK